MLQRLGTGLLVTEVMGQGVNTTTGDYSRGAAGFWVENGEIAYPVEGHHHRGQPARHVRRHRRGGHRRRSALAPAQRFDPARPDDHRGRMTSRRSCLGHKFTRQELASGCSICGKSPRMGVRSTRADERGSHERSTRQRRTPAAERSAATPPPPHHRATGPPPSRSRCGPRPNSASGRCSRICRHCSVACSPAPCSGWAASSAR